jgi:hypothetical protein
VKELIEHGLLFGGLKRIEDPHLRDRYNGALAGLRLTPTALASFHIDATGYSPEIAQERGDDSYLDPRGVNRLFVILTPEQRSLPIIRTSFSADLTVWRRFFDANQKAIETLTLADTVFGEIENLVLEVEKPSDIVGIEKVTFDVHTVNGTLEQAGRLKALVARFDAEPDAWRDDKLMAAIVEGAEQCGDIRRNGVIPAELEFDWPDVSWTSHFGGCYLVRGRERSHLFGDLERLVPVPEGMSVSALSDADPVIEALDQNAFLEPVNPHWLADSGIVDHRIAMMVAELVAKAGTADPREALDDRQLPRLIHQNLDILKRDSRFRALTELRSALAAGGSLSVDSSDGLMIRRALPEHPDVWEVNRLLSEFVLFDLVTLYILNKPRFYEVYASLAEPMKQFAVAAVTTIYHQGGEQMERHKQAVRERFFGAH